MEKVKKNKEPRKREKMLNALAKLFKHLDLSINEHFIWRGKKSFDEQNSKES